MGGGLYTGATSDNSMLCSIGMFAGCDSGISFNFD